ncbi:hypothetical protein [Chryseobacterium sp. MFBS3-17]|uniref:hypothetical protein n=1 Tax=Chryseobacterium sp. MFBS3-17 TaxID=2886689 RepID=UPI001D0EED91|nr:hypothetical protein [Chryseobacterium sp. MFBS3-17]MCC2589735.1 hypothetical protein [Chryseobacterium sp. MFBS3-17]
MRYSFVGGKHPAYKFKIARQNTTILPLLYTCESVDSQNPRKLIPEMEVNYIEGEKYMEVELSHKNLFIDENFQNIYLGYISLGYDVVRQKRKEKVGDIKCYRGSTRHQGYREVVRKCSVMSLIVQ